MRLKMFNAQTNGWRETISYYLARAGFCEEAVVDVGETIWCSKTRVCKTFFFADQNQQKLSSKHYRDLCSKEKGGIVDFIVIVAESIPMSLFKHKNEFCRLFTHEELQSNIFAHSLVKQTSIIPDVPSQNLPNICWNDPLAQALFLERGQIIATLRKKQQYYYRVCVL